MGIVLEIVLPVFALIFIGWLIVKLSGLPWGHRVSGRIDHTRDPVFGVEGWLDLTLPRAQLDATIARLRAIPGIAL